MSRTDGVLAEVRAERAAQDAKWGQKDHPDGTGTAVQNIDAMWAKSRTDDAAKNGDTTWEHILTEEYAEALAEREPSLLRAELIQTAAVAVSWIEAIDRRSAEALPDAA